jgi:hypothetical protein
MIIIKYININQAISYKYRPVFSITNSYDFGPHLSIKGERLTGVVWL